MSPSSPAKRSAPSTAVPASPRVISALARTLRRLSASAARRVCALLAITALAAPAPADAANPIITSVHTADPAAMVHDGKVYLYTGHDEGSTSYVMRDWLCYSTSDMVNWKAEGSPMALNAFTWALQDAWAGHVVARNGKFYFYVPMSHRTITGFAIGVGVSDSPTGPFVDARGTALITNNMTVDAAGKTNVFSWDDIDPAVFVDDDGQAYLFWGNTICHYVKLKANMIETDGPIQTVTLPQFTEAPWVHKRNGLYYLSYAYGWEEKIAYATSTSIAGPWTFRGVINDYVANCNTNHQSIIEFKGQSYFIYHNGGLPGGGSFRRSVCVDYLNYNADGTIQPIVQTLAGVGAANVAAAVAPTPAFSNVSVHDPSVMRAGDTYYVFGSHLASASTTDLLNWTQISTGPNVGNALVPNPPVTFSEVLTWAQTTTFWAPDHIRLADGKYYMYYCACKGDSPRSALGLAVADSPAGPYSHVAVLLKSGMWGLPSEDGTIYDANVHPNVVDPSVFFDPSGKLWMVYGSYSGGIFILEMDPATGRQKPGQGYGKKLIGGNHARIEGAYILRSPETGYYYMFLSYGGLDTNGGYNIRVGRSLTPDGPYVDAAGNDLTNVKGAPGTFFDDASIQPYGVKLMGSYQFLHVAGEPGNLSRGYRSPGHNSAYFDPVSRKYSLVFHTRFVNRGEQHEVRVHQMFMNEDGWPVVAPQRFARETIGTTTAAQVPGSYKLINHGKAITATVVNSFTINLNTDNSITGGLSGSWQLSGDRYATLTLGGVTYRGVFSQQWDDDTQVWVRAFSAISGTGVAVWGSKVAAATASAAPTFTQHPQSRSVDAGTDATLAANANGSPPPLFQWKKNGTAISGATGNTYVLSAISPSDAGLYTIEATGSTTVASNAAVIGVATTAKTVGSAAEVGANIVHPNGNSYDQVLLQGSAATITADPGQVTRISYIDLTDDIVQVEFSGAGTLSIVLDNPSGPAAPVNYNQTVTYMKGHASISIVGANETTNVSVFSVGRITAVNQALFKDGVAYDGLADIAFISIQSADGKFGGIRTANTHYLASKGLTGIYAPGVQFTGPVFVSNITANDAATPVLLLGAAGDTRVTGGDLLQPAAQAVEVSGITQLKFVAGSTSHGGAQPAQANKATLVQNGVDVTAQIVVNP